MPKPTVFQTGVAKPCDLCKKEKKGPRYGTKDGWVCEECNK